MPPRGGAPPSRAPLANVEDVRVRQEIDHEVTMHGEAHLAEQPRQRLGVPVPNRCARVHHLVENVSEPALVGGAAIHILDEEPASRGENLGDLLEEGTYRLLGNVVDDVEHVGGVEGLAAAEVHHVPVSYRTFESPSLRAATRAMAMRRALRSKPSRRSPGWTLA